MPSPNAEAASRRATVYRLEQALGVGDDAHPAPAAAEGGLDQDRVADACGLLAQKLGVELGAVGHRRARQHRHTCGRHQFLGGDLGAHRGDRRGTGSDEHDTGLRTGGGEFGVLREESIAGVDRIGAGAGGRRQHQVATQVGVGRRRAG